MADAPLDLAAIRANADRALFLGSWRERAELAEADRAALLAALDDLTRERDAVRHGLWVECGRYADAQAALDRLAGVTVEEVEAVLARANCKRCVLGWARDDNGAHFIPGLATAPIPCTNTVTQRERDQAQDIVILMRHRVEGTG